MNNLSNIFKYKYYSDSIKAKEKQVISKVSRDIHIDKEEHQDYYLGKETISASLYIVYILSVEAIRGALSERATLVKSIQGQIGHEKVACPNKDIFVANLIKFIL